MAACNDSGARAALYAPLSPPSMSPGYCFLVWERESDESAAARLRQCAWNARKVTGR